MSRMPRECYNTSFFHVIVQGINKEFIFYKKQYIEKYLYFLNEYKEENKIEIIAYCVMNNHAHILIYTNSIKNMSKYMQIVNTKYAKYYNYMENERVGYVFRDRYISEPINKEEYLIKCINYIHQNPIKAGIVKKEEEYLYSSYNEYMREEKINEISKLIGKKYSIDLFKEVHEMDIFADIDNNREKILENAISEILKYSNFTQEEILKDKIILSKIIRILNELYKIKYTEMMKYLGITKGRLEKLKKR